MAIKKFNWRIGSMSGEVEASDHTDAMCQAIRRYSEAIPYFDTPTTNISRIDIIITERVRE